MRLRADLLGRVGSRHGHAGDRSVTGVGYLEMTGYDKAVALGGR